MPARPRRRKNRPEALPQHFEYYLNGTFDRAAPRMRDVLMFGAEEIWRLHREAVLKAWIARSPGTRPPAWWEYDAPERRRAGVREIEVLRRHALLTPAERNL